MARILVADDDIFILQFVEKILRSSDHEPILTQNGAEALETFARKQPDLVLLDVMMPKMSGIEVCRKIRAQSPLVPILMLTAQQQLENKLEGFGSGADDYITKPFDRHELLARIQTALRRQQAMQRHEEQQENNTLNIEGLTLHPSNWQADYQQVPLKLSRTEFKLLRTFCEHPDQVLDREYLLNTVWNYQSSGTTRTVDNFIMRLRKKLQSAVQSQGKSYPNLETLYGIGYRLNSCADRYSSPEPS